MRLVDDAWNQRDWETYASFIAQDFRGWMNGDRTPHGKEEHLRRGQAFCEAMPANHINCDPYIEIFASPDGSRTCTISTVSPGTETNENTDAILIVVCRWQDGRIITQHESISQEPFQN
jgi:hypothetical protein